MSEFIPEFMIRDILDCIRKIQSFTKDHDFYSFVKDEKTIDAVLRNIEVIGEAVNRIPDYFINEHPEVNWRIIVNTRNRLIHGYDSIDYNIIWEIISNKIPELRAQLEKLL
jgi:uncharacterized protein with HEPN domain